jgi:hypothetical protein
MSWLLEECPVRLCVSASTAHCCKVKLLNDEPFDFGNSIFSVGVLGEERGRLSIAIAKIYRYAQHVIVPRYCISTSISTSGLG